MAAAGASRADRRILALDVGLRRTGVALSDTTNTLASPLETVSLAKAELIRHICGLIREHDAGLVVIGLPQLPSGDEGAIAPLAREIGQALERETGVAVRYQDEALTSWEAESMLARGGRRGASRRPNPGREHRRRARTRKGEIDRLAAALILQEYLDTRAGHHPPGPNGAGEPE
jgi:putative Holliday junction resolvase